MKLFDELGGPFDLIFGLPVHPLVVHSAVVLVPLVALAGIAMSYIPSFSRRYGKVILINSSLHTPHNTHTKHTTHTHTHRQHIQTTQTHRQHTHTHTQHTHNTHNTHTHNTHTHTTHTQDTQHTLKLTPYRDWETYIS